MIGRIVVASVSSAKGTSLEGVSVVISHSSGRVIYDGQTHANSQVFCNESYDSAEGGYLIITASAPGYVPVNARMIEKTIITDTLTAAYQALIIMRQPRKRF